VILETSTISLREIETILRWQILAGRPSWRGRSGRSRDSRPYRSRYLLITLALAITFPCQFSSPIMTGAIGWDTNSYELIPGRSQVVDLPVPHDGTGLALWKLSPQAASVSAHSPTANLYSDGHERDEMKHDVGINVINLIQNSTLAHITIPYFVVKKIEWIKNPATEISQDLMSRVLSRDSETNPWSNPWHQAFGLVPDSWDFPPVGDLTRGLSAPSKVSERRLMVGSPIMGGPGMPCDAGRFGKTSGEVGFVEFRPDPLDPQFYCLIFGWVSYDAGAADCDDCRLDWFRVVRRQVTKLKVKEDLFTREVLDGMHWLTMQMVHLNYSTPLGFYDNLDGYVSELLLRSYAGLWSFLTTQSGAPEPGTSTGLVTDVRLPSVGARASVNRNRVAGWLVLNVLVTIGGALFLYSHLWTTLDRETYRDSILYRQLRGHPQEWKSAM
jgi:hypothetical protein